MPPDEARAFEEHLRQGCVVCRTEVEAFAATTAHLGHLADTAPPSPSLRARVMGSIASEDPRCSDPSPRSLQVWKLWENEGTEADSIVRRRTEEGWQRTTAEGVAVRRLFVDAARQMVTMLVRMDPGSSYPPHRHADVEECFVLQGDLHVGDELVMHAGDYQRVGRDSVHDVQSTEGGCLLFIVSSLHDEILA
jgi:anti-sigma factor ChrR (cupin superfamily)